MYCQKCGRENSNDAKFCNNCGQPVSAQVKSSNPVDYEFCSIERRDSPLRNNSWWDAKVGGRVIESLKFSDAGWLWSRDETRSAHLAIVAKLKAQGWEVLTTNQYGDVVTMQRPRRN